VNKATLQLLSPLSRKFVVWSGTVVSLFILLLLYFSFVSNGMPPVKGMTVETITLKSNVENNWAVLRCRTFKIRVPFDVPEVEIEAMREIVERDRAFILLGATPTLEGEPILFEEQILAIDDESIPDDRKKNTVNIMLDIYRFDSNTDHNKGEYRSFLHFASNVFRRKDVDRVLVVEGVGGPFQIVAYQEHVAEQVIVYCDIFSDVGNAIGRLRFSSNLHDTNWIFESIATITPFT
jgi:hypothetical protein